MVSVEDQIDHLLGNNDNNNNNNDGVVVPVVKSAGKGLFGFLRQFGYGALIGLLIVTLTLIPVFSGKTGLDVLQSFFDGDDVDVSVLTGDPPEEPFENTSDLGYELLDNGTVFHMWNQYNNYYFLIENGIQFSNHYLEYWTRNVLMLGYYDGDEWNLIYRTDELSGFNKNIIGETDDYINATLWKDLSYGSYDFRLAIRYCLGVNDSDLTIVPYIKNLGVEIPYVLGFGWEMKDINIANVTNDNYLRIYNNATKTFDDILLNQSLNESYTDLDLNTTINLICKNPPSPFLSRNLYLRWNSSLNYKVTVKSRDGQFNAPVTLFIKVGTLAVGQEKFTKMNWLDADNWLGITSAELNSFCGEDSGRTCADGLNGVDSWAHSADEVHWFILDLGQTYTIKKLRSRSETSLDPIDVNVYIDDDNPPTTLIAEGITTWQDDANWVEIDITDSDGRYIKVEIEDTEGDPANTLNYGPLSGGWPIFDAYGAPQYVEYYFDAHHASEKWETNPGNMVDGTDASYAETDNDNEVQLLTGNTCPGNNLGTITKVELQAYGKISWDIGKPTIDLRPVFAGGDGDTNDSGIDLTDGAWYDWIDITGQPNAPNPWTWSAVNSLDCDVIFNAEILTVGYVGEVQIRVTYTPAVENTAPTIECFSPDNASTGNNLTGYCRIWVNDTDDGDKVNITWRTNETGSWVTIADNNTQDPGSFDLYFPDFNSEDSQYWWEILCDDGTDNVSKRFWFETASNITERIISQDINGSYTSLIDETIVDTSINGSYTSLITQIVVDQTVNGSYTSLIIQTILDQTINGSYRVDPIEVIIIDQTINGSYTTLIDERIVSQTINGSYTSLISETIIDQTINGSYVVNLIEIKIIDQTINGSYVVQAISEKIVSQTINGSYTTLNIEYIVSQDINGSYQVTPPSETIIDQTINGSYVVTVITERIVDQSINGSYTNVSVIIERIISTDINGSYKVDLIVETIIDQTINGSYIGQAVLIERIIDQSINGSYRNVSVVIISLTNEYPINGSNIFSVQPTLYFTLDSPLGEMSYKLYIGNTNITTDYLLDSEVGLDNDTFHYVNYYNASVFGTSYFWRVHYNDTSVHVNETFNFSPVLAAGGGMGGIGGAAMGIAGGLLGSLVIAMMFMRRRRRER